MQVMFMITDCEACHALTPDLQKVAANLKVQQQLLAGLQDIRNAMFCAVQSRAGLHFA
jgi:hypothetical protein